MQKTNLNITDRLNRWRKFQDPFDRLGWHKASKLISYGIRQEKNINSIRRTFPKHVDLNIFLDALDLHDTITATMMSIARGVYPEELEDDKKLKKLEDDLRKTLHAIRKALQSRKIGIGATKYDYSELLIYIMYMRRTLGSKHYDAIDEAWRKTEEDFIKNYIDSILRRSGLYPSYDEGGGKKISLKPTDDGDLDI